MSKLQVALDEYLAVRRALGFKLRLAGRLLQRFVDKTPWAHLDIAGTAMGSPQSEINRSWGSGFGVRLLDGLVAEYYEK